jgi:hypothetical protein
VKRKETHRGIKGTKAEEVQASDGRRAKKKINVIPAPAIMAMLI